MVNIVSFQDHIRKSKPGYTGFNLMMQGWFRDFVADVELSVIFSISNILPDQEEKERIKSCIMYSKKFVPFECRIAGSFFTHLSVIGRMKDDGGVTIHFDEKDSITALVHLGSVTTGGSTHYFNGNIVKMW